MLKKQCIDDFRKKYEDDRANKIRQRMLNKVQLVDLIQDNDINLKQEFSIDLSTHGVTDQQNSSRCWAFAGLNILREKVIDKCKLTNFELAGSYIAFYDKLERYNIFLERLSAYKKDGRDLYDRYVSYLLETGITDGGYFTRLASLIKKYGIVPKDVFPETYSSANTYEVNQILSRLLRKFYLDLDNDTVDFSSLKSEYLEKAFIVLASVYGLPPEKFDFEFTDRDGKYHLVRGMTPKKFYDEYIGVDLSNEYVEVISYQDDKIKYNNLYATEENSTISGEDDFAMLNLSQEEFQNVIVKQLKHNEPVYFYSSTTAKRIDGVWFDIMERYGDIFGLDLKLDKNSILKTNGITGCHCMLITGVNILNGETTKWKIENSWGSNFGNRGYYVATDDWVKTYVHRIVVNKKFLSAKQSELLDKEKIRIEKWDEKF